MVPVALLFLGGAASLIYGVYQNNSIAAQWASLWQHGTTDPGTLWIVVGVIAMILGVILFLKGSGHR